MKMLIDGYIIVLGLVLGSIGLWFCLAYLGWMNLILYLCGAVMMASIIGAFLFVYKYRTNNDKSKHEKIVKTTPLRRN